MASARRRKRRETLKGEIRDEARAIFVRDGYENFSMRKLGAALGCSPGAIYLYFESREDLFRSLVEESFARLHESLAALADEPGGDPVDRLKRGLRLYVDWGTSHPDDYRIAFLLPPPSPGPYRTHRAFDVLRTMVAACLPPGKEREESAETASQAIWAAVHGITSLLIQRPSFPWRTRESVTRQVIDSAVDGALPAARRRPKRGGRHAGPR